MIELAVLGLLHEAPMHGYELRKRLAETLGAFRAFSYGSLYPALRRLQRAGLIVEEECDPADAERPARSWGRRAKRVYRITAEGKERFAELLADGGPQTWDDDGFGVHMAFFSRTPAEVRMRILEGRRSRLQERLDRARATADRGHDRYVTELQRHTLESMEREVRWLTELIDAEHGEADHRSTPSSRNSSAKPATRTSGKSGPKAGTPKTPRSTSAASLPTSAVKLWPTSSAEARPMCAPTSWTRTRSSPLSILRSPWRRCAPRSSPMAGRRRRAKAGARSVVTAAGSAWTTSPT